MTSPILKSVSRLAMVAMLAAFSGLPAAAGGTDTDATAIIRKLAPIAPQPGAAGGTDAAATGEIRETAPITPPVTNGGTDAAAGAAVRVPVLRNADPARVDAATLSGGSRAVIVDRSRRDEFEIRFAFGSAELDPAARAALQGLGRALADPALSPYAFLVAGHTDAKGAADFNMKLSAARAAAVAQYLAASFAIAPERLYTVGFGETALRRPDQPLHAANRRVEVMLVASVE